MAPTNSSAYVAWTPPPGTWWTRGNQTFLVMGLVRRTWTGGERTEAIDSRGRAHLVGKDTAAGAGQLVVL